MARLFPRLEELLSLMLCSCPFHGALVRSSAILHTFIFGLVLVSEVRWDSGACVSGGGACSVFAGCSSIRGLHVALIVEQDPGGGGLSGTASRILCSSSSSVLSRVQLFVTPWTAARQASLSITNSRSSLKLMSVASVMPSNHLILCHPLLLPPSIFPSIRVFSNESALHIRRPKYRSFSFSISPSVNIQG